MIVVKKDDGVRRPRGRPRAFDREEALAKAAETFWRLGYEGASIADLTAAMAITPQSLYAAFSSKADLYREALAWYQTHIGAITARALEEEDDVVAAFERVLAESSREFSQAGRPHGCMVSTAILTCAVENEPIARHVGSLRDATLSLFRTRIAHGITEGQLRPGTDVDGLARFVGAIVQGMSVQAQDGATEKDLLSIAKLATTEIARHRA